MMPPPPPHTSEMCVVNLWCAAASCQPSPHHRNLLPGQAGHCRNQHSHAPEE